MHAYQSLEVRRIELYNLPVMSTKQLHTWKYEKVEKDTC